MFVAGKVSACDFYDYRYSEPVDGVWMIARGATGRYCPVMCAGPEWLAKNPVELLSMEEAEKKVEELGGWLDF